MKIWIDLRFINDDIYSRFTLELVKNLIKKDSENFYIFYTNSFLEWLETKNSKVKNIWISNFSIKEQTTYLKILKDDKNDLMIFFNHFKPVFYVWEYYTFVPSLKEIYYSNFNNYFEKYSFLYLIEKNLKRSKKIICFDENTNNELIEKFNLKEENIKIIDWFFPCHKQYKNEIELKIDIKTKYDITNKYFIYSAWEWVEKNYEKVVLSIKRLIDEGFDIDLVFIWDEISKNINLRNLVIKLQIQKNIHFLWIIKPAEKVLFYKNSMWVIFPSLYEPFPFKLTSAVYFDTKIIASNIKSIKNIFWEKIKYFSPLSVNSMFENLRRFISEDKKDIDYSEINKNFNVENTTNKLIEIIN